MRQQESNRNQNRDNQWRGDQHARSQRNNHQQSNKGHWSEDDRFNDQYSNGGRVNNQRSNSNQSNNSRSYWDNSDGFDSRSDDNYPNPYRDHEFEERDREFYRGAENEGRYSQTGRSNYGPEYGEMYPGARRNMRSDFSRSSSEQDRQSRGEFSGVGPKNFSRSKERIIEDVNQKLTDEPRLDASNIEVEFENGEVILRGQVNSRECKRCAEDIAEQVSGVRDVRNELRVGKSSTQKDEKSEKMEKGADSGTAKHRQNPNNPDMRA